MSEPKNVTQQITMRQGLAILNEARKRAPLTYLEHAQCDEIFRNMDEVFAQSEAAAVPPAVAAGEAVGGEREGEEEK